eukprot:353361-Chlamydomonas_euryale.AAC.2
MHARRWRSTSCCPVTVAAAEPRRGSYQNARFDAFVFAPDTWPQRPRPVAAIACACPTTAPLGTNHAPGPDG